MTRSRSPASPLPQAARTALLAFTLLASASALAAPSAIYLVRHGEKQASGADPALTDQGKARAANIATLLRKAGITAVFSSRTRRTEQTAAPLAQALGLTVHPYDADQPEALVASVKAVAQGAVLVVGHSNTLPVLVRQFGGEPGAAIGEDEFDRVYQLHTGADGKVVTTVLLSTAQAGAR